MKAHRVTILIACICLVSLLAVDALATTRPERSRPEALLASPQADSTRVLDSVVYSTWDGGFHDTLKYLHAYTPSGVLASTIVHRRDTSGAWIDPVKHHFEFDDQDRLIANTEQEFQGGLWQYTRRMLFHYGPTGLLEDSVEEYRSGPAWQEFSSWHYAYDAQDRKIEEVYRWFGGTNAGRELYAYDGGGNMTARTRQFWDTAGTMVWIDFERDSLWYDHDDNNTQRLEYFWVNSAWVPGNNYTYTYDAHDNMTEEFWQYEDGGHWINTWYFQYTYDAHDNRITYWEQHWGGSSWDNVWRDSSVYDGQDRIVENHGELWDWSHHVWLASERNTYGYDSHGDPLGVLTEAWDTDHWENEAISSYYYSLMTSAPTDVGSDVQVDVDDDITLTFDSVSTAGSSSAVVTEYPPFLTDVYVVLPVGSPEYIHITTDADYEGPIEICLGYDQGTMTQAQEDSLVLLHYAYGSLHELIGTHDTVANIICGTTDSLSPFALAIPGAPTGMGDGNTSLPHEFALKPNYPNPFNPTTVIAFELPRSSAVEISIYNVLGQEVRSLVTGERAAGRHNVTWDGRNNAGRAVPSGMYFYRIQAGEFVEARKMLLLK